MSRAAAFVAGLAVGWIARSTVDTSREGVVRLVSIGLTAADRLRRIVALEREWLDDLAAEAKARTRTARERQEANGAVQVEPTS